MREEEEANAPASQAQWYVWKLFDAMMIFGTCGLGACYVWARHLGHVGTFCDISDLVVHMPERILFRMNFSLVGAFLAALSFPIYDLAMKRVGGTLPKFGAAFQFLSGLGVVLVAACGPEELLSVHLVGAFLGFGGSAIAQIIYNFVFWSMDKSILPESATKIFAVRCIISAIFLLFRHHPWSW